MSGGKKSRRVPGFDGERVPNIIIRKISFWKNVVSEKCRFGKMSFRENIVLEKCCFGKMSFPKRHFFDLEIL